MNLATESTRFYKHYYFFMYKDQSIEVVKNAISFELCSFINQEIELFKKVLHLEEGIDAPIDNYFNDVFCTNSFSRCGLFNTDIVLLNLQEKIETVVQKKLFPTYSFARVYYTGSSLAMHVDRPSCEISASLCISNDPDPWELWFETQYGKKSACLHPGDIVVYNGCLLPHWRNEYTGNRQVQVFLHYVDQEGKYSDYKYDCRLFIGAPYNEEAIRRRKELDDMFGIY